jgi:hypothetical protein
MGPIIKLLVELAWQRPEQGFGKLFQRLRRLGRCGQFLPVLIH